VQQERQVEQFWLLQFGENLGIVLFPFRARLPQPVQVLDCQEGVFIDGEAMIEVAHHQASIAFSSGRSSVSKRSECMARNAWAACGWARISPKYSHSSAPLGGVAARDGSTRSILFSVVVLSRTS